MAQPDRVRQYLRRRGVSASVVKGGLEGLVDRWDSVVDAVREGYDLTMPDYVNDIDLREVLRGALEVAPGSERQRAEQRVSQLDRSFRDLTVDCGPVCGEEIAAENGLDPVDQWWYYRRPRRPGPDFEEELRQAGLL
jgi:hypothetical protein